MASRVLCLNCGEQTKRTVLQQRLEALNPTWSAEAHGVAPDGDVFLTEEQVRRFHVAACTRCGGPLKPDVVFFGDTVPRDKVDFVHRRVQEADSLLVVGSSLQVPGMGLVVEGGCSPVGAPTGASDRLQPPCTGVLGVQVHPHCSGPPAPHRHPQHRAHTV